MKCKRYSDLYRVPPRKGTYWIRGLDQNQNLQLIDIGYSHNLNQTLCNYFHNRELAGYCKVVVDILEEASNDSVYFD